MFTKSKIGFVFLFGLILVFLSYIFGLFVDLAGDAGKYASIARNIVESGDFINLKIHGDPYDQKPPLIFWLASLGFRIDGFTNFGFKIFPFLYGLLGIFFTYKLGKSLYNRRVGLISALLIGSSGIYFLYTMDIHTDLILQTNVTLAIWQFFEYLKNKKVSNFILAFVAIGLALLSKGPVGAAVPAFALITHLLLKRDYREIFRLKWLAGILIALIIALPAFIGLSNQFGFEGLKFFFWTNNAGRISGHYSGTSTDYFYYFHTMLYLFAPWSLILWAAVFMEFSSMTKKFWQREEYFTLGGIWIYFIIISLARGKSPNYIFMLVPLFSIITAKWINILVAIPGNKGFKVFSIFQNITIVFGWGFLIILMGYLFPSGKLIYWILLLAVFAATIFVLFQKKQALEIILLPGLLFMGITFLYLNSFAFPYMFSYQASTAATRIYNERAQSEEHLNNYIYEQFEVFFYSKDQATLIRDSLQLSKVLQTPGSWIFTNEKGYRNIQALNPANIDTVYHFKHRGMTRIGGAFILPSKRESSLQPMFLVKTNSNNLSAKTTPETEIASDN